jgi:hypothetical protein
MDGVNVHSRFGLAARAPGCPFSLLPLLDRAYLRMPPDLSRAGGSLDLKLQPPASRFVLPAGDRMVRETADLIALPRERRILSRNRRFQSPIALLGV